MSILRESEEQSLGNGPTRTETSENKYPLRCWACGQLYYVNATISGAVKRAAEIDPSENAFCCDDCAAGYEDEHRG